MFQIDRAILFLSIDHVIRVGDYIGVVVLPAGGGIHVSDVAECYGNHLRVQWNLERKVTVLVNPGWSWALHSGLPST